MEAGGNVSEGGEEEEEAGENVSEEGERTEETRKVVASEKEGNIPDLSVEGIMESVGSPGEEGKLKTPVPVLHITPSYYHPPPPPSWHR